VNLANNLRFDNQTLAAEIHPRLFQTLSQRGFSAVSSPNNAPPNLQRKCHPGKIAFDGMEPARSAVVAQEVKRFCPEVVAGKIRPGQLSVAYGNITGLLS